MSNVVSSQVELHGRFHGVVPELASRAHQAKIAQVIESALAQAVSGARLRDLRGCVDVVGFTQGPGLAGALLVGKVAAQTLSWTHGIPIVGVNHLEGHAFTIELCERTRFPFICLIVSGGHADLVLVRGYGKYRVLGRTRDDAAGEAFDKVAKLLELGYPGGPVIDRKAAVGDPAAVYFPRPLLPGNWDFSFSGLKTAVLYQVQKEARPTEQRLADLCASFQEAIVDTLVHKTLAAARQFKAPRIVIGGGVAANSRLRKKLAQEAERAGIEAAFPPPNLCTDNGAMIAHVAALRFAAKKKSRSLSIDPSMPMDHW